MFLLGLFKLNFEEMGEPSEEEVNIDDLREETMHKSRKTKKVSMQMREGSATSEEDNSSERASYDMDLN